MKAECSINIFIIDYDGNPEPILPPNITHISGTRYRVDITDSIPSSTLFNSIGYTTAVVMVTAVDSSKYYVLVSILYFV